MLKLTKDNTTKTYSNYYSSKEFKTILKEKYLIDDFSIASFMQAIKTNSKGIHTGDEPLYFTENIVYFLKSMIDAIDFNIFKLEKEKGLYRPYSDLVDTYFYGGIVIGSVVKLLGFTDNQRRVYSKVADEGKYLRWANKEKYIVNIEDVLKWCEFQEKYFRVDEIIEEIISKINKTNIKSNNNTDNTKFYYDKFKLVYKNGELNEFKPIKEGETCFKSKRNNLVYFEKKYKDDIFKILEEKITKVNVTAFGTREDKIEHKIKECKNVSIKSTLKVLLEFANDRLGKFKSLSVSPYLSIVDAIEELDKEISSCNDDEVNCILSSISTKCAKEEFCMFLNYLKSCKKTIYKGTYILNRDYQVITDENNKPYTDDQYFRFGFLVLSNTHIWYEEFMKKATCKRVYAGLWLYAVFHYISAWRGIDLREKFPRPNLYMKPEEFIEKVKNKELEDSEALEIVEQVDMKLKVMDIKPNKTKSYTTPNLVMEIPESIRVLFGTLVGLAEAHFQLSYNIRKKGLIPSNVTESYIQREFFGEEFTKIFGKDNFTNQRAVKNYERLLNKNGDEENLGTGYVLASIARSHKFTKDQKSKTTQIYLDGYREMEDSEIMLRELYERGVCSFVPYILAQVIKGVDEIKELDIKEQTSVINELVPVDNYDAELILQLYDKVLDSAKTKVNNIIKECIERNVEPKKVALDILKNIIHNKAQSKEDGISCIVIAQGKNCIYPLRKKCVGCGEEIYLKSFLKELGNRINEKKMQVYASKTKGTRAKNILMINKILVPIAEEIIVSLREIYGIKDIEEYKKMLK